MRYKVGEEVAYVGSVHKDMEGKKGVIIYICKSRIFPQYLVEFYEPIDRCNDGDGRGKPNHCWWAAEYRVLNNKDSLDIKLGGRPKQIVKKFNI